MVEAHWSGGPERAVSASTCTRAAYGTLVYLRNEVGAGDLCNDDACSVRSIVNRTISTGAGLHNFKVHDVGTSTGNFSVGVSRP